MSAYKWGNRNSIRRCTESDIRSGTETERLTMQLQVVGLEVASRAGRMVEKGRIAFVESYKAALEFKNKNIDFEISKMGTISVFVRKYLMKGTVYIKHKFYIYTTDQYLPFLLISFPCGIT